MPPPSFPRGWLRPLAAIGTCLFVIFVLGVIASPRSAFGAVSGAALLNLLWGLLIGYAGVRLGGGLGHPIAQAFLGVILSILALLVWATFFVVQCAAILPQPGPEPPMLTVVGYSAFGIAIQFAWITLVGDVLWQLWCASRWCYVRRKASSGSGKKPLVSISDATAEPAASADVSLAGAGVTSVTVAAAERSDTVNPLHHQEASTTIITSQDGNNETMSKPPAQVLSTCGSRCRNALLAAYKAYQPLPQWLAVLLIICIIPSSIVGIINGQKDPVIQNYDVPLARLPPHLDGYAIAVLTDLHIGAAIGRARLNAAVDLALRTNPPAGASADDCARGADAYGVPLSCAPDIVVIVGDLMDNDEALMGEALQPLMRIGEACNASMNSAVLLPPFTSGRGRGCGGAFFVSGNHDEDRGSLRAKQAMLAAMGIRTLINERVEVGYRAVNGSSNETFDLAGVPDWSTSVRYGTPHNMWAAVAGRNTSRELVVLAHQPAHAKDAGNVGAGLTISGHVHGGQMMPVLPFAAAANLYWRGLVQHTRGPTHASNPQPMWQLTSQGTYQWGPIFRQASQQEVCAVRLRAGQA